MNRHWLTGMCQINYISYWCLVAIVWNYNRYPNVEQYLRKLVLSKMSDIKSFLHHFCQKNKIEPTFEVRPTGKSWHRSVGISIYSTQLFLCQTGPKHRQRFLCEVRVSGHTYVGAGNSTNKKDAQSNASKDFVSYLVRQGIVSKNDVPVDIDAAPTIHRKLNYIFLNFFFIS